MREKIKKIMILSALLLVSVFFSRCQNDEYLSKTENTNLLSAKTWFDNYKTKENFHPAFKNIEYNWENAYAVKLENASGAIAIPMKDNPENSDYKGKKILYLYPSDSGYDAVVHEIFPKQEAVSFFENKKQDFQNLDSFSGYILTWNLRDGFIKGAEFEKGLVVKNISSAIIFSDGEKAKEYNLTRKAPADWQLELDPVSVTGGSGGGGCAGCGGVIRFTPTLGGSGVGGGSGGYIGSPRGGSGAGTGTPSAPEVKDDLPPSCESFNFTSKKGSNWQEAAVKNITLRIVVLTQDRVEVTNTMIFPQAVLFGMPINYNKGNGDVTPGAAATVSAIVLNKTMKEIAKLYTRTLTNELTLRTKFQELLINNYRIYTNGGTVNFNSTSSLPATNYKTNPRETGLCDD